jgi:uncharacterized protein (TIGR03066 family)
MNLVRGLAVSGVLLCLIALGVEAGGASKDTKSLFVGKWKMQKKDKVKEKEFTTTITAEFTKDGVMKVAIKAGQPVNKEFSMEGKYKFIDDTTVETTIAAPGQNEPKTEKMTIETLTKTKLVLVGDNQDKRLELDRVEAKKDAK